MLDVLLRGGSIVDGDGGPRRRGDVGILGQRIVAIGEVKDSARRIVNVEGKLLAPGFVDIHTHFDAQAFWDSTLSPSPLHGVTTIIGGNCGFSIAPLRPHSAEYLVEMLAQVEAMPAAALRAGAPWDWSSTGEYLDRLEGRLLVNAGFLAGHSAIRRIVMRDEATSKRATEEQLTEMSQILRESLAEGALGFSSSWGRTHHDGNGDPVPSRHASADELIELSRVCGEFEGTSLEFLPKGSEFSAEERDLVVQMSLAAGRPLNWNIIRTNSASLERDRRNLEVSSYAAAQGGKVVGLAMPLEFSPRFCFLNPFVLENLPDWREPMRLPVEQRIELLLDPKWRKDLEWLAREDAKPGGFADWASKIIAETFTPATKRFEGRRVGDVAVEENKSPFDALLDISCADGLRTTFCREGQHPSSSDWEAKREIWRDPRTVIGASDAGAHLNILGTFAYATYLLGTVVREQALLSLEEAIAMLTSEPAALYGLNQRGRLREGSFADIVVFDEGAIANAAVGTRFDLPSGAGRLYADAVGIDSVYVNGSEVVHAGEFTTSRPGKILRSGRDTSTPIMSASEIGSSGTA